MTDGNREWPGDNPCRPDGPLWAEAESQRHSEAYRNALRFETSGVPEDEPGPRFTRFRAALAQSPELSAGTGLQAPVEVAGPRDLVGELAALGWPRRLSLVGAAAAGVLAGVLVSTDFAALPVDPAVLRAAMEVPGAAAATSSLAATMPAKTQTVSAVLATAGPADAATSEPAPADPPAEQPGAAADIVTEIIPASYVVADDVVADDVVVDDVVVDAGAPDAATVEAEPEPVVTAAAMPAKTYRVQLATLRDRRNVAAVWQAFVERIGRPIGALERYVVETETARGHRHLVQVGPFADAAEAEATCRELQRRGGDCLVIDDAS